MSNTEDGGHVWRQFPHKKRKEKLKKMQIETKAIIRPAVPVVEWQVLSVFLIKMRDTAVVLIDGGYFAKLLKGFGNPKITLVGLSDDLCRPYGRFRTYFYDALPWMNEKEPDKQDKERRAAKQRFFDALSHQPRFEVRLGRLQKNQVHCEKCNSTHLKFDQKLVDVLLSVDLVRLAWSRQIKYVVIVGGDSDFVPAVKAAKDAGALVKVAYAKGGAAQIHQELLKICDERQEIDLKYLEKFKRTESNT